jgi:hypothetical protein
MSNLPPDPDSEWSEEELLLLRSAEDDRPSSRALAATLAAVGVGAATSAATSAAAATTSAAAASTGGVGTGATATAAKWGGAFAISKWVSIVALGGAAAVTTVALERHARQEARQQRALAPSKPHASVPVATPVNEQRVAPVPAPPPVAQAPSLVPPAAQPPRGVAQKRKEASPPRSQPDLSREIALIDDARSALRANRGRDCLAALDRYDAEHAKSGSLQLEAAALRIEALFQLGDHARAQAFASAFLAKHETSPYAGRIHALVAGDSAAR